MDRQGKLPVYVDGSYFLTDRHKVKEAIEETRGFQPQHAKGYPGRVFACIDGRSVQGKVIKGDDDGFL